MAPIVPAQNIAGRALVLVIAIMTFLSCLTFGAVTLVRDTASVWENQISREATIQIKPVDGLDMEAALAPSLADRRRISRREGDQDRRPRGDRPAAGAVAGLGPQHRRTAGAAPGHRHHRRDQPARFRRDARGDHAQAAERVARRSSHLGRPAGRHGPHHGDHRHCRAGADAVGNRADRGVRDARRHGRQRPHHRGAAFRRRRGDASSRANSGGISWSPA